MPTFNTTDPKPGYVYDSATDTWFPLLGLATQTLDGLTDVIITTAATNQVLAYNGTNWVNSSETGDITAVTAGTGITVTNGTGPIPTIAINTATTVDLSTAQTLTNKTIDASTNTLTGVATLTGTQTLTNKTLTAPKVNLAFNAQTGTTYTLVAGDSGKLVTSSNGSAVTITIPTGVFAAGEQINIQSIGVGLTTISGASVTITSTGASAIAPILRARYSAATIICTAAGVFTVIGDIA